MSPLEILLEILKLTIPGLVVFATVYVLMKHLTQQLMVNRQADQKQESRKVTVPLRLQAYERLSLFCERISIPALTLRLRTETNNVTAFKWLLLQAIQQEFEHNITQQIYVSETLWKIVLLARDSVMQIIDQIASDMPKDATVDQYVHQLYNYLEQQEKDPIQTALAAIKREAAVTL
jgi:cytochrome c1